MNHYTMGQKTVKFQLKKRITLGINYGLQSIEEVLNEDSMLMNEFIHFKSQYNDLNRMASLSVLKYEEVERGFATIRLGLLGIIDRMEPKDTQENETLPALKNNEIQFRKNNFFQLLDIHYANLANITLVMSSSYGDNSPSDTYKGMDAVKKIYTEFFQYGFLNQNSHGNQTLLSIEAYSFDFFDTKFPRLEPYMKTLRFILDYISEEEMEQSFFLGILQSVLSTYELLFIFYFAISGIEPKMAKLLRDAVFFDERLKAKLLDKEHFELLVVAALAADK